MSMAGTFSSIGRSLAVFWFLAFCISTCCLIDTPSTIKTMNYDKRADLDHSMGRIAIFGVDVFRFFVDVVADHRPLSSRLRTG